MPTRHVKKKMHTQRRYATCPQGMSKKKKEREKMYTHRRYATCHKACQKKEKGENIAHTNIYIYTHTHTHKGERIHIKEFHPSSTRNIHTLALLDHGL